MANRSMTFYHPNGKGTGSAMRLSLVPAQGISDGCIHMELAGQMTVGDRINNVPAQFDWDNKIVYDLEFQDLCLMLQVLLGETESINDGRGLYCKVDGISTIVKFNHIIEPVCGYMIEAWKDTMVHFMLSPAEALGLSAAIYDSMPIVCFGIPSLVPSAY